MYELSSEHGLNKSHLHFRKYSGEYTPINYKQS